MSGYSAFSSTFTASCCFYASFFSLICSSLRLSPLDSTINILISPTLILVTKNNPSFAFVVSQPSVRNENYLQHLSILFPPPSLVSTRKNTKFITESAKFLMRHKLLALSTLSVSPDLLFPKALNLTF